MESNKIVLFLLLVATIALPVYGEESEVEKGRREIQRAYEKARALWAYEAYRKLPTLWAKQVEADFPDAEKEKQRLADLDPQSPGFWTELRLRYGLHPAPYENGDLPLGLTKTEHEADRGGPGISVNCQFCHSNYLPARVERGGLGKEFAQGIPNVFADMERLHRDLSVLEEFPPGDVMVRNHNRNTFNNHSDFFGQLVAFLRPDGVKPNLLRYGVIFRTKGRAPVGFLQKHKTKMRSEFLAAPPIKTQPWVNYVYKTQGGKRELYVDGGFDGEVSDVTYAMAFSADPEGNDYVSAKNNFKQVGEAFLKSLTPLPYPFAVSREAAERGEGLFHGKARCFECHGTYQKTAGVYSLIAYPKLVIPVSEVGTDPVRNDWNPYFEPSEVGTRSLLEGTLVRTGGYVAPPLVGIWSRAPYLHNGSVPTLAQLLDSSLRESTWYVRMSERDEEIFDTVNVGMKTVTQSEITGADRPYYRQFDPSVHIGMDNTGHTYGDRLSGEERRQLLEFLKLL